ncbi:MAG: M23 family metallopeptidase [Alistipes sp.]|nr:M23 family metallopeptidase [Alistipes sp.]MBQ6939841.1 M23 family metallopeptidase [Alistipes sp.]
MLKDFWDNLTERCQLSMRERESGEMHWQVNLSPLGLWGGVVGFVVIVFLMLLLLMAYTPILDILPGYRTRSARMTDRLTESILHIDSLEREMTMMLEYNEAVAMIMSGSTPTLQSTVMTDTIRYDKSRILPTRADSLLRNALESFTGEYSLASTKPLASEAAMFSAPVRGTVTRAFDAPESSFDMAIMPIDGEREVMAVESGTVVGVEPSNNSLTTVVIQHAGGYISVYRELGESLVRKGQSVHSGTVIGNLSTDEEVGHELVFELWRNGAAVDPQRYILF